MSARSFANTVGVALIAMLMPAMAFAQASITGVVRDTSGAVLPGVNVEAASPALIEKVRSTVTTDTGQYRIENLRPGTYSVTFTLPGFSTVKRDAVELQGSFSATINADLRVGEIAETITVTRASRRSSTCRTRRSSGCSTTRSSTRFRPAAATRTWRR